MLKTWDVLKKNTQAKNQSFNLKSLILKVLILIEIQKYCI